MPEEPIRLPRSLGGVVYAIGMDARDKRAIPAVSWIGRDETIAELVYDETTLRTAFAVWRGASWELLDRLQLPSGETLVPFSPHNNLIKNEVVVLPSSPVEYSSDEGLLAEIRRFIHQYVDISESFEQIASYYILLSWLYDAFKELPYLRFQGDYGTGKTRALLTIGSLCYKGFFASGASTVSPIFHILDAFRGTLVIDEADFRFSDEKSEIVKILNNGNVDGLPVLRTMQDRQKEFNPRAFKVYGPKIIAMRGSYDDRALESRFLTETMGTRTLRTDVPINLPEDHRKGALEIRNKLLLFRFRNRARASLDPTLVNPFLEPRLNQILVPLLSVVKDTEVRTDISEIASTTQASLLAERGQSVEAQVLEVLIELASRKDQAAVPLRMIAETMIERYGGEFDRAISSRWIGSVIRKRLNILTYKSNGTFAVPITERKKILHLCRRYGVEIDEITARDVGSSGTN